MWLTETSVTGIARIRALPRMDPHVHSQSSRAWKPLRADRANVGPFPRVPFHVLVVNRRLGEGLRANGTSIGTFTSVYPFVSVHVGPIVELTSTITTLIRFLTRVDTSVLFKVA